MDRNPKRTNCVPVFLTENTGWRAVSWKRFFPRLSSCLVFLGAVDAEPASPLRLTPISPGCYRLDWQEGEFKTHTVEGSRELMTWEGLGRVTLGPGGERSVIVNRSEPSFFFRLREGAIRPGFDGVELAANDDYSSSARLLPFVVNFLGTDYDRCFVNNNGNITFGDNLSVFTPEDLRTINAQILAAFWADVDTRAEGSGITRFSRSPGPGVPQEYVDGHRAFGATYSEVGHFDLHPDKLNSFQIVIIEREDTGAKNFDVEFNYSRVEWEAGDVDGENGYGGLSARAGIAGRGPKPANQKFAMEIEGSGMPGAFLDNMHPSGAANIHSGLIYRRWNTDVPGRLRFEFRQGALFGAMRVNAGPDTVLSDASPLSVQLHGEVSLAGGAAYKVLWSQTSGVSAQIANESSLDANVTLSAPGNYIFRLTTSTETVPSFSSYDEVSVIVEDEVLRVHAGDSISLDAASPYSTTLVGSVNYTGSEFVTLAWSQSAGDPAEFDNATTINPQITLPGPGLYEFKLTATTTDSPPRVASSTVTVTHADP